jgi:lambda repressor-like predicted transcriptional regulator
MSKLHILSLATALTFLSVTKTELKERLQLDDDLLNSMHTNGVTLEGAEIIASAFGYHPSEIWGERWVDAVLTLTDWSDDETQ